MQRPSLSLALAAVVCSAIFTGPADAQESAASLEQAAALLQDQDWAGAAGMYRALTEAEPDNAAAWLGLGRALYASRQADPALSAYTRAFELGFQPTLTMLEIARVHAAKGEDDTALDWLEKAVAAGSNLYRRINAIDEFKRLGSTARYRQLIDRIRPCNTPAHRQLDFWIGSWRVVVGDSERLQQVGTNAINRILNGCAVIENWTDNAGNEGKSLFYFHDIEQTWKQVWVTDGQQLKEKHLIAVLEGGALRFQGEIRQDNGALILDRTTLYPLADERVRQLIEQSADGGETWHVTFDALYIR